LDVEVSVAGAEAAGGTFSTAIFHDVSERKRAEAALREQSAILEATLENMGQGITLVDRDLNTVALNRKFLELQEFPEERFGRGFAIEDAFRYIAERGEYGPGDVEEQVRERLELTRKFLPHRFERTRPNGTVLEIVGNPIEGGGFVSTYTDITERKRAEEALRESEERYALAMKGANDGLWDWDLRKNEIYISPVIQTLPGLQSSDLETTPAEWESRIHPDDLESYHQSLQANLRGETEFYMSEYRARGADGTYRWVLDRGFGLRDEAGQVHRMAGSMGDITARKQAEEELAEKEAQLRLALDHMPRARYSDI
jgi:PAS domain S-box-containing protein